MLGVAIWHGPGASNGIGPYLAQAPGFLRAFGARGLARAARIQAGAEAYHPASEHWYLQALGVHSGAQGCGIGTLLLRHGLARADQQGIPSYLESSMPRTGVLCSRMGFHPLRRVEAWPEGAPYGMWRPVP